MFAIFFRVFFMLVVDGLAQNKKYGVVQTRKNNVTMEITTHENFHFWACSVYHLSRSARRTLPVPPATAIVVRTTSAGKLQVRYLRSKLFFVSYYLSIFCFARLLHSRRPQQKIILSVATITSFETGTNTILSTKVL